MQEELKGVIEKLEWLKDNSVSGAELANDDKLAPPETNKVILNTEELAALDLVLSAVKDATE